nr:hypothetical protein [Tanacetum cinerariifolium]
MDQQYPTVAKIPILDIGKFEQWQFRIQQYLRHEHYALWEVIEFGDSYEVPESTTTTDTTSGETGTKLGRTVTLTAEDMQKKKNDVKARTTLLLSLPEEHQLRFNKTTLLLSLPEEHQLRFNKYKTARELWAAILKTFGGNEATKKTKKNLLKQQYGNFKEEGSVTLEQTFNRLQVIIGQLQFMDRNMSDLDTMSLDDLYNHLKVYKSEVEKMGHFARECRAPKIQDRGRRDNYKQGSKAKDQAPKALMAIDRVGWDWSYMANDEEDHALVADEVASTEFALMANTSAESKDQHKWSLDLLSTKKEKLNIVKRSKLLNLEMASKNLDNLIKSQRSHKNKDGLGYSDVPPPPAQLYSSLKKDLSWTGLPEFADDTVTDYSPDFVMKKKAYFSCSNFNHLAYDCTKRVKKSFTPKPIGYRPYRPPVRPVRTNMNGIRPNRTTFNKQAHSYANRPFHKTSAVRLHYRALWVPTVNRNFPPVNRKFYTGSRNFPTANRKFPTASRKFPAGSSKCSIADMGMKGKGVKPSACWFWKPSQNLSNKGPNNNSV